LFYDNVLATNNRSALVQNQRFHGLRQGKKVIGCTTVKQNSKHYSSKYKHNEGDTETIGPFFIFLFRRQQISILTTRNVQPFGGRTKECHVVAHGFIVDSITGIPRRCIQRKSERCVTAAGIKTRQWSIFSEFDEPNVLATTRQAHTILVDVATCRPTTLVHHHSTLG